jgi:hypothetical protein
MAPASIVFPDPLFLFQTPDENDEQRFHCIKIVTKLLGTTATNQNYIQKDIKRRLNLENAC